MDGVLMGRSDAAGTFRITRDPFRAPADCTVAVNDGSRTAAVTRLTGCSVSNPPPTGDTTPPTAPRNLSASVSGSTVTLSWTASTDNVGVTGYRVRRNGAAVASGTGTGTTFVDPGLAGGSYTYTVVAVDNAGNASAASNGASVTVAAPTGLVFLTPSRLPDATVGQPYLGYIVVDDLPGTSDYSFRLVSGKVPAGTAFSGNTLPTRPEARVTGTPTVVGTSTFTVEATEAVTGLTARRTFTLAVVAVPALSIPSGVNVLDPTVVGADYSGILPVSGGGPLQTWALTAGALPPGLALGIGVLWGVPTTAGSYSFTARVTDNLGASATGQYSVTVAGG